MIKINLYDKFFHSPNWDRPLNEEPLDRFRAILKSGYILSCQKQGMQPRYSWSYRTDSVYLSVHPDGDFRSMYTGKIYPSGYRMSSDGLFFILSAKLMEDYKIESSKHVGECTVLDQIELYKYLVGIGNAGFSIDDDFVTCFSLIKYFNGEITETELINIIRERNLDHSIPIITRGRIEYCFGHRYQTLPKIMARDVESFVRIGYYHDVVKILDEVGQSIPLYDKYGYPINLEECFAYAKEMHEYIGANLNMMERDGIVDAMQELIDRLFEKYNTTSK